MWNDDRKKYSMYILIYLNMLIITLSFHKDILIRIIFSLIN